MQQSSMILFCDECGAANEVDAIHCVACQSSLVPQSAASSVQALLTPVSIVPQTVREVMAGAPVTPGSQRMPVNFLPGTLLAGHYRIHAEIGRGGFSIVYRAEDLASREHRWVAIKRIYLSALNPRQIIDATETFNREVRMLARFQHISGIPAFYEHLTDPENWYLVMEYIEGQTLEEYMQHAPGGYLSELETLETGIALASIVQELHKASPPVIFRDLKPSNIIVTPTRALSLVDFGIARDFTPGKKKDTTPLGSPGYAPPEQYGREQTDSRADIYSLGATLSTLLTGREPLELAQGEPARNPHQPSRVLRKLLDAMMERDVARRPAHMQQVRQRLLWIRQRTYWPILLREELRHRIEKLWHRIHAAPAWWQKMLRHKIWQSKMGPHTIRAHWEGVRVGLIASACLYFIPGGGIYHGVVGYLVGILGFGYLKNLRTKKGSKILPQFLGVIIAILLFYLFLHLLH